MIFFTRLLAVALYLALLLGPLAVLADSEHDARQHQATQLYQTGDYRNAFRQYLKLAKKGDEFSRYRVSSMLREGRGTKADLAKSYAWAALAAETKQPSLVEYRKALAALLPLDLRDKAERKTDYYLRRWGRKPEVERDTRADSVHCTGSRVGRCQAVFVVRDETSWTHDWAKGSRKSKSSNADFQTDETAASAQEFEQKLALLHEQIVATIAYPATPESSADG